MRYQQNVVQGALLIAVAGIMAVRGKPRKAAPPGGQTDAVAGIMAVRGKPRKAAPPGGQTDAEAI